MATLALLLASVSSVAATAIAAPERAKLTPHPHPLDTLKPQEWFEVKDGRLSRIAYKWPEGVTNTANGIGFRAIVENWNGGAYDAARDRLLVWGGGHFAYAGNEIYAFDVSRLTWERASDPSLKVDTDYRAGDDAYEDGTPRSSHSYGTILHVPTIDRFCSFGTTANFPASRSGKTTWCFDFGTRRWERRPPVPSVGFGSSCAWDPVQSRVWCRMNGTHAALVEWDPTADAWQVRAAPLEQKQWAKHSAAVDPVRRRYVAVGGGKLYVYDIGRGASAQRPIASTGPQDIVEAANPGFEYDPVIDRFVGWSSGPEVLTLDPDTYEWRRVPPAASSTVRPTAPARNGTFGRFRYVPSRNAYIVVNGVDEGVFLYRLSDLKRASVPPALAEAARSADPQLAAWARAQVARFPGR
jgi:hypothetical protein